MGPLKHLFPTNTSKPEKYVYPQIIRRAEFKTPPRDDRVGHATSLIAQIESAEREANQQATVSEAVAERPKGVTLDFSSETSFKLELEKLEVRRSGIELCNSRMDGDVMHATVFVPEGKVGIFVRKLEAYKAQKPRNQRVLVESISEIRLAALRSFWTDAGAFPTENENPYWWEIWLREKTNPHDVSEQFREAAAAAQVEVRDREIRFPERRVLLARATVRQWTEVLNLFDVLAELRLAKTLPSAFVSLPPREQAALVDALLTRIHPPQHGDPAVCHLDTGVNRGHPLLALALAEADALSCDPNWTPADTHPEQHGTGMAGLALYDCLTRLLGTSAPVRLRHRLESVKILESSIANDPELYGKITDEAIGRIEVVAPGRDRAFCLTITADSRDEGFPSSWSAALDKTCAGADDNTRRLLLVSTGNLSLVQRRDYPDCNHVSGVEDPSQSWNAVTVGAYTERAMIESPEFDGWEPIARPGSLSPGSRTSIIWDNKSWPLKPDIVMEGGNNAKHPQTGAPDFLDDLSLLTTRLSPTGALFTTTGDTSAATALAARYAAIIYAHYPHLWPETVRAILIHSARWTDQMLGEFPPKQRHWRLRCYGYGVPSLERALWSLSNAATMVIQHGLQPFDLIDGDVKTKDMHIHRLPWPKEVLQELGEVEVSVRVTLSYFIEPNPGRRGWTRKHRYQSHGLRFDVKHPLESETEFRKRLSKAAREEDEELDQVADDRSWVIGERLRCKGSVHSDMWKGTAADLAACGMIAVYPVTGWWKESKHLERWNREARYSLIVTIESPKVDVDLYTPIATEIGVPVETVIET